MRTAESEIAAFTWLKVAAIAAELDVSEEHVRALIKAGAFGDRAINVALGSVPEYRVHPQAFEAFKQGRKVA